MKEKYEKPMMKSQENVKKIISSAGCSHGTLMGCGDGVYGASSDVCQPS